MFPPLMEGRRVGGVCASALGELPQANVKCLARMVNPWSPDSVILHRTSVGKNL